MSENRQGQSKGIRVHRFTVGLRALSCGVTSAAPAMFLLFILLLVFTAT